VKFCFGLLLAAVQSAHAFSDAETRAIASHGPWPPAFKADPSNRVSGNNEAIALGERLFFERRLSAGGAFSCSRCHLPERNWTDGEARALGLVRVPNTPSLANVRLARCLAGRRTTACGRRACADPRSAEMG
jgi:cytochrome c peroxidase